MSRYRGLKIVFGFGFVAALSCIALLFVGRQHLTNYNAKKEEFVQQFVDRGYAKTVDDAIIVRQVLDGPVVLQNTSTYKPLSVHNRIKGDAAIVANSIIVAGHIDGDLDFFAPQLNILGSGSVTGNIRSEFPSKITISGTVGGKIYGKIKQQKNEPPVTLDDSEISSPVVDQSESTSSTKETANKKQNQTSAENTSGHSVDNNDRAEESDN